MSKNSPNSSTSESYKNYNLVQEKVLGGLQFLFLPFITLTPSSFLLEDAAFCGSGGAMIGTSSRGLQSFPPDALLIVGGALS